jgi:hypothetical protein
MSNCILTGFITNRLMERVYNQRQMQNLKQTRGYILIADCNASDDNRIRVHIKVDYDSIIIIIIIIVIVAYW